MFSTKLSKRSSVNNNNAIFQKNTILRNQDKAYSILLHSITMNEQYIFGYSDKYDSIMTFPLSDQNFKVLQGKLDDYPENIHKCNTCHK